MQDQNAEIEHNANLRKCIPTDFKKYYFKWTQEEYFSSTAMPIVLCVSLEVESCDRKMLVLVLDAFIPMYRKIIANNNSMSIEKKLAKCKMTNGN